MSCTTSTCPRCHAVVLRCTYDVLAEQPVRVLVDPTPLDKTLQVACVVVGRPLWRHENFHGQHEVGSAHWAHAERIMRSPDDVLPEHACRARMGDDAAWLDDLQYVDRLVAGELEPPF